MNAPITAVEPNTYPVKQVLELACAAQRINGGYIKQIETIFASDDKAVAKKWDNRTLIVTTLDPSTFKPFEGCEKPQLLCTNKDDAELADDIKKFYKRLLFAAVQGDNEFLTEVNALLEAEVMRLNKVGFIACLPSVYKRDAGKHKVEKASKIVDAEYLGEVDEVVLDLDCEVLSSQRSKNFDAFNIDAIINNKMVTWISKIDLKLGPAVLVKGRVKDQSTHWKHGNAVTRLNYVRVAQ